MKNSALLPLFLVALNVAAMQPQQENKTTKKKDNYDLYSKIGAKITAGVLFGGIAYFIYQLSNNPELEAAKKELIKYQPVPVGWMDSFDERFKKALISCHKNMSNQGLLSMLELLTAYSIASSGIISTIAFKSAYDDYQKLNSNNLQEGLL